MKTSRRLILWDVDGTLVLAGSAAQRAFDLAVASVTGREAGGHGVHMSGKTDPEIAMEIMAALGMAEDEANRRLPSVLEGLTRELEEAVDVIREHGRVLPGVRELLPKLHQPPAIVQSVLTGNLAPNAALKVKAFGLEPWLDLEVGAYGSDHRDRTVLVPVAMAKAEERYGHRVDPREVWVVGDTPRDLECAQAAGARCLLVGTGRYSFRELQGLGAEAVVPDLGDVDLVCRLLLGDAAADVEGSANAAAAHPSTGDNRSMSGLRDLLRKTAERVADYREGAGDRPVAPSVDADRVRASLGGLLPQDGLDAAAVIEQLVEGVDPALMTTTGPRYFGYVIGGALDAATSADMLATGWDQVAFNATTSPAGAIVEEVVGEWLKEAFGLPAHASFGLVTGAQGANTVGLAAARHRVLERVGWNVEERGLVGAPRIRVIGGEERHATIDRSLRLLGIGASAMEPVVADANGAIDVDALGRILAEGPEGPTIVCLQAGHVNTGACDDLAAACEVARRHGAWVHVDGAFGLWAAVNRSTRHLVRGIEGADSWGVDGHKWLNVPYDAGYVFCADPVAHAASMSYTASYLEGHGKGGVRAPGDFVPESSRRARAFATWAALRQLGTRGLADLIDRCCALARRFGDLLAAIDGVEIGNDIVLNQVLVSFGSDDLTDRVTAAVQREGTAWMGGTTWRGRRYMRVSVSNWSTTEADVDRSVEAIKRLLREG